MRLRALLVLPVVLAVLVLACSQQDTGSPSREAAEAPIPAPDFQLRDLAGHDVSLSGLRGRVVVLDFWATWCAPCVFQIPVLNAFQEAHQGDGVVVIGISVDVEGEDVVRPFAKEHGIEYTILLGDEGLARQFGAVGFPSLFVIAPDGSVDSAHVGIMEGESLEEAVARALQRAKAA